MPYALRALLKSPSFTTIAISTIALGIAANTAIFSVVNGVLLRPLPFRDEARIVRVWTSSTNEPRAGHSAGEFLDIQHNNRTLASMAGVRNELFALSVKPGDAQQLPGAYVTASFFDVLGTPAALGRTFTRHTGFGADRGDGDPRSGGVAHVLRNGHDSGRPAHARERPAFDRRRRHAGGLQMARRGATVGALAEGGAPVADRQGRSSDDAGRPVLRGGRENQERRQLQRRPARHARGRDEHAARTSGFERHARCRPRAAARGSRRQRAQRAAAAAGSGRARPAHRVRQRLEPADRAGHRPAARAGDSIGAWRVAHGSDARAVDREPDSWRGRRRDRIARGLVADQGAGAAAARRPSARRLDRRGRHRRYRERRRVARHRRSLRIAARVAGLEDGRGERTQGGRWRARHGARALPDRCSWLPKWR